MTQNGLKELSNYTITSKYAKYLPEKKRRENWEEIVDRSLNMHLKKFSNLPQEDLDEIKWAFGLVKEKKVLPSMRGLQYGGEAIEKKNARQYNCCFLHVHNSRCIEKVFYLLLCGVGCGFSLRDKWISKFPSIVKQKSDKLYYTVEDNIEDWATSTKVLVDSFLEGNEYTGKDVTFDYSLIRPKGSPLSHGGSAPGHEGLKLAHDKIKELLLNMETAKLRSIDVYDILMHVSDAVLSGGLRRAACIALFDKEDDLMMNAKTGNWFMENPQRARSNNTALLKRDEVTLDDFKYIVERTREFGEPGFSFVNDLDSGTNPCGEATFLPFYSDDFYKDEPAVQFCNLTNINGNKVNFSEDLLEFTKAATIIGTLQSAYTDFPFLDKPDQLMTEEEALLGVGLLGFMANPTILLDENILTTSSNYAVQVNEIWAEKLGINPAARVTVVKPDGNSSCVLESPFSGIHPAHSSKYFRRVQANTTDAVYKHFQKTNPHLCEPSIYSANKTDDVITFPIDINNSNAILKQNLSALDHLEIIKKVQKSWIKGGEKNNKKDISHSVSCTVLVNQDEWETVAEYLYNNRDYFTSVALLSRTGDKDYKQVPYEALTAPEDFHVWNSQNYSTKPVDYTTLVEETDNTVRSEELACMSGVCTL